MNRVNKLYDLKSLIYVAALDGRVEDLRFKLWRVPAKVVQLVIDSSDWEKTSIEEAQKILDEQTPE